MDWLYSSPGQVDREQYLLGKKIDRQVDPLLASEDRERQVHSAVCLKLSSCLSRPVPFRHWQVDQEPCS